MDPATEPTTSLQTVGSNLARSRSRYKGPRLHRPPEYPVKPLNVDTSKVQRFRTETLPGIAQEYALQAQPPQTRSHQRPERSKAISDRKTWSPNITRDHMQACPDGRETVAQDLREDFGEQEHNRKREAITEVPQKYQQAKTPHMRCGEQLAIDKPLTLPSKSLTQRITRYRSEHRRAQSKEELKRTISAPIANEPPRDAVIPAFDAPISSVNTGERRVKVKHGQSVMSVPVLPSTTPTDIICSAREQSSVSSKPKASVVLESFKQLGLERPLRRYERVRDVMNSWDNDTQNTLVIIPSPTDGQDVDLDLSNVSSSQPGDTSVHIYHSQKRNHWDKRWITLRSDGQVLVAKKNGSETSNICHLSDYDIYIPTARHLSKHVKPPRKICFAIKSQQKSSVFMSTENFVHFFSTNDKVLASAWYRAVQEWRSWYLVNVMGEGKDEPQNSANGIHLGSQGSSGVAPTSNEQTSLIDKERTSGPALARGVLSHRPSSRGRGATSAPYPRKLSKDVDTGEATNRKRGLSIIQAPASGSEPEPFASTGLLGRTYTLRQKAQRERDAALEIPPSTPPYREETNPFKRPASQHQQPKPLIDLTPQYQEPPQHARKGRGISPTHVPPEGLIEMVPSPEYAVPVPPSTTWQRPQTSAGGANATDANEIHHMRTMHTTRNTSLGSNDLQHLSTSPIRSVNAFVEGGLLTDEMKSQGGTGTGRGVMAGDRSARAPMLDVGEDSQFGKGSLLERLERATGVGRSLVIERDKRREVNVRVGEGV